MFAKLIVVSVLDLVKIVLVQLSDERGKVGVLEHPRQNRFCELVHVLDDKTVPSGTPRDDMLEIGIFEHSKRWWPGQPLHAKSTRHKLTCRASSRNRTWKTSNPPLGHVSTTRVGSCLAPGVLYAGADGTPVSPGGVSGQVPLSGLVDFAMGVGRKDGRIREKSGVDREHIWSRIERGSLSGGGLWTDCCRMSQEGVEREEGAGKRGTAGAAGEREAGRIVQTDPL
jgi:hypothetical protein